MAATMGTNAKNNVLRAMFNNTHSTAGLISQVELYTAADALVKYKALAAAGGDFGTVANRQVSLTVPLAVSTHSANGTITKAKFTDGTNDSIAGMVCGLAGTGHDIVVNDDVISAAETPNITAFTMEAIVSGTAKANTLLCNRIITFLTKKNTSGFAAAGTVTVYSGSAPASADDAASGTALVDWTTGVNTFWADASGGSIALTGSKTSNAATNAGTAGYARISWTSGGETYVIQGSVGTSGTDFVINTTTITTGTYTLSAATVTIGP